MPDDVREIVKLKVCLAGDRAVGKTSLIRRFVHDVFDDRYQATMGAKVTKKEVALEIPDLGPVTAVLSIWDIMGDPGFRDLLREAYFHGAQGILAVCDVTRPGTLESLEGWKRAVHRVAADVPMHVLANKADLGEEDRLAEEDLAAVCGALGSPHRRTSAKTGTGVEAAFVELTRAVVTSQVHPAPA